MYVINISVVEVEDEKSVSAGGGGGPQSDSVVAGLNIHAVFVWVFLGDKWGL